MAGGCDHFELIDDALYDRATFVVFALMLKNENLSNKIEKLQKVEQERKVEKKVLGFL